MSAAKDSELMGSDITMRMIYKLARGIGAGAPVARSPWMRTLHAIRTLPGVTR